MDDAGAELFQLLQAAGLEAAEEDGETAPLLIRYVTVAEWTDAAAKRWLSLVHSENIAGWEIEGMLRGAIRFTNSHEREE